MHEPHRHHGKEHEDCDTNRNRDPDKKRLSLEGRVIE